MSPLADWHNFYSIVGSSAGALTGLQFVVIALIAQGRVTGSMTEIRAFGTPTVVHFCAALLISAIVSVPWHALHSAAIALIVCGAAGVLYAARVILHAQRQSGYAPDAEDWAWYAALPLLAYAGLLSSGALLFEGDITVSLHVTAATALLLLFIGIRNAWDTVTYVVIKRVQHRSPESADARDEGPGGTTSHAS